MGAFNKFLVGFSLLSVCLMSSLGLWANADQAMKTPQSSKGAVRISMESKGFSIVPPKGWQIEKETPGVSLLMRSPRESFPGYFPTLQVTVNDEAKFIDELTVPDFKAKMSTKITNGNSSIKDYRFLDHSFIELGDGRAALLFYAEFDLADSTFMQALLLTSSETHHYILTFTDSSKNFDNQTKETFFNNAWTSMISLKLDSPAPTRTQFFWKYTVPLAAVLVLFFLLRLAYRIRSGKKYGKMLLEMDVFSDDLSEDLKSVTPMGRKIFRQKQKAHSRFEHHENIKSSHHESYIEPSEQALKEVSIYPESVYASLMDPSGHDAANSQNEFTENDSTYAPTQDKSIAQDENQGSRYDNDLGHNLDDDEEEIKNSFYDDDKKAS